MKSGVVGILLAAGQGRRFGGDKLRHPLPDGTPIGLAAARLLASVVPDTRVVVRPGDTPLARLFADAGFTLCIAEAADSGMGHSLAAGVGASIDASGWLVALADMPFIQPSTIGQVVGCLDGERRIVQPQYAGTPGHPVAFSHHFGAALQALHGDQGAREVVRGNPDALQKVPVEDPGVLRDIDRPTDL